MKSLRDAAWSLRQVGQDIKCSHRAVKCALEAENKIRKQKLTEADVRHLKVLITRDRKKTTADLQTEMSF